MSLNNNIITVKNADSKPDTTAEIILQNKIGYIPKVSVIIPVYNTEEYLRQCLDSIVNQTLKEIEIICVDDCSTDNSLEILKEYAAKDKRITVMKQENLHAGVARNAGLAVAKGKYLSFLDSDDFFELDMLEETYNIIEKENVEIIFYQYKYYNNQTKQAEELRGINISFPVNSDSYTQRLSKDISSELFTICNPMPWNKLISHQLIQKENIRFQSLAASNDIYFSLISLACSHKIVLLYKNYVYYRSVKTSLRNSRDKYPFNFYEAYKGVYNTLLQKKKYEQYKKTFLSSFMSTAIWTFNNTVKMRESVKNFIKNTIIPEFSILNKNKKLLSDFMIYNIERLYQPEIIISLTSYPARINTVNQTIESLLNQSMKADKVILWLAPEQFPNREKDLPKQLLDLKAKGLTIDWYHDIKSYKKLIPTLHKYPDAIIVTADDDVLYMPTWLERLYNAYMKYPNYVHCHRAHKVVIKSKQIAAYKDWVWFNKVKLGQSSYNIFLTGVGGVLYPPYCLHEDVLDEQKFLSLSPKGDDIWFWAMALRQHTKINIVENALLLPQLIDNTQETALWRTNQVNNDRYLANILEAYPEILNLLEEDPDTTAEIVIQNKLDYIPKVSVIIPVYNAEEYLRQCLDSVINQTLKEIEIICVDDGSTDNSLKILKEYAAKDKRMTVITQENLYAGVARNAGLAVAKGEYVHFLDSDDWVDLDTYEELYYLIKEKKVNFMKFKSYSYCNKEKKIINHAYTDIAWITEDQVISIDKNLDWAIKMSDAPWSGFYNLVFLNENNIRFNNLKCANDVSFFINCLIKSRAFYFSTKRFVYYRRNNDKSLLGIRPFNFNCQIETYHIINKIAENEPPIIKQALKDRYSASILSWYKQYMEDSRLNINTKSNIYNLTKTFFDQNKDLKCRSDFNFVISPLLFKDIGLGCNTWCEPRNVNGCSYTYDLSDNIYTRYVSWDPIKEGSCDVEIMRLSAVEKRSKKVVEFPISKIVSSGKIVGNKVAFRNQKGCWIGCTVEGAYESFTIEAKITNS